MRLAHLGDAVVDGVEQGGAMVRVDGGQPRLNVFDGAGEVLNQLRPVVEADDEELVLGIGGLDELEDRFAGADQLGAHGAGEVENDADRNRGIFAGKARDFLLAVVLEDLKVFLFQASNQAVERIGDGNRNQHHVNVHADERAGMDLERRGAGFGSRFSPLGSLVGVAVVDDGGSTWTLLS